MRALVALASVLLLAAPVRSAVAGACRTTAISAEPLATSATIAGDGGVVIGWNNHGADDAPDLDAVARWSFTAGTSTVAATATTLAPGLTLLQPRGGRARKLTLRDDHGHRQVKVTVARTAPAALRAPAATISSKAYSGGPRSSGGSVATAVFVDVPDRALAVIVYPEDERGEALSWGRVGGSRSVVVFASPGRCAPNPPGTSEVSAGARVRLAWVDRHGRVSPRSAPIEVTAAP